MSKTLQLLIQIGAFSALVATFLIPSLVAQFSFGLRHPWPMVIGVGSMVGAIFLLLLYVVRKQREDQKVLSTSHHAVFGDVRQLRNHWEATLSLNSDTPDIEVFGEARLPSQIETENFTTIRERYSELLGHVHTTVRSSFSKQDISIEALRLESIMFSADAIGSFDLAFSSPLLERHFPWGLTVSFVDFQIDEISDNH